MSKITEKDLNLFLADRKDDSLYRNLRLGQTFIAFFNIQSSYPDIYYENDEDKAIEK